MKKHHYHVLANWKASLSPAQVQQSLAKCRNLTLLVIAHRLKTIEKADQIVLVMKGRVQERGTHQELMEMKGSYYKLKEEIFSKEDTSEENWLSCIDWVPAVVVKTTMWILIYKSTCIYC